MNTANLFAPQNWRTGPEKPSLQVNQMTGLLYNPLTKTYKLSPSDVDVNYMISTQKC